MKQVTKLQSPDQSAEEIRQGISEARSMFNAYQLEILALQEFTASTSSSEISQERKIIEETAASRKAYFDGALARLERRQ